jgi:hypothetical protein
VEGQAQRLGQGVGDHAGVEVRHQAVGLVGRQQLGHLLDAEAAEVDDRSEPVQEVGHLLHAGLRAVDHPQQIAHAGGRFGQLHDGHAPRPVAHRDERKRALGGGSLDCLWPPVR